LKIELREEIEMDIVKKVHKMITEELIALNPVSSKKKPKKKKKGKKGKKGGGDDDEKEDEETKREADATKMDKLFAKKIFMSTKFPSRRDNFSECVKLRFLRKIKPIEMKDLVGGFD